MGLIDIPGDVVQPIGIDYSERSTDDPLTTPEGAPVDNSGTRYSTASFYKRRVDGNIVLSDFLGPGEVVVPGPQ